MIRVIAYVVLCCALTSCYPFPYAPPQASRAIATLPRPLTPLKSNNPYNNNPYYNNPYYNSPYYNKNDPAVPIVSYSSEHVGDGTYAFSFTTGDGKQAQENGFLKDAYIDNAGNPQGTQVVQGSFAYFSPEGTPIKVSYIADENGFRPAGVHIPADGKTSSLPLPIGDIKDKKIFGSASNRYSPYNYRNRNNNYGLYTQPYDTRYPYDASTFNNYNSFLAAQNKNIRYEEKRESV